ncbi:MAG: hypothetical protein LBK73_10915 [Treponema sp.]|jgi:hypothetical protein|nr:hypothetical protein [Treponema sp.]
MKKMKKKLFLSLTVMLLAQSVWANDPPAGGERLFLLGHPGFISGAMSSSGGGVFAPEVAGSHVMGINPALAAGVQRFSIDAAYTGLVGTGGYGNAFYAGALFPSRYGVFSGSVQGAFLPLDAMNLGNTLLARAGFSRDVTERLFVGASLYGGGAFSRSGGAFSDAKDDDWALGLDAGFVYSLGNLAFLKNARYSVVIRNMGKNFIDDGKNFYPGILTPAAGFAAVFVDKAAFTAGFSADVSVPFFQNLVFSVGLQAKIARFIMVSAGWDINLREMMKLKSDGVHLPLVGIGVQFAGDMSKSGFMSRQGWQKTDFDISGVWQQLNDKIQLFSVGVTANFGVQDKEAPIIQIGDEE